MTSLQLLRKLQRNKAISENYKNPDGACAFEAQALLIHAPDMIKYF